MLSCFLYALCFFFLCLEFTEFLIPFYYKSSLFFLILKYCPRLSRSSGINYADMSMNFIHSYSIHSTCPIHAGQGVVTIYYFLANTNFTYHTKFLLKAIPNFTSNQATQSPSKLLCFSRGSYIPEIRLVEFITLLF